jgi:hypothetical protein
MPTKLSDWSRLGDRMAPKLIVWMPVSAIASGAMLYICPIESSSPVLASIAAVVLAPIVFFLGWITGASNFASTCDAFRRVFRTFPIIYVLPFLVIGMVALGLVGGRYWWIFSLAVGVQGFRCGVRRSYWSAVSVRAFAFRSHGETTNPHLFQTDGDALAAAIESINKEIGRPSKRD